MKKSIIMSLVAATTLASFSAQAGGILNKTAAIQIVDEPLVIIEAEFGGWGYNDTEPCRGPEGDSYGAPLTITAYARGSVYPDVVCAEDNGGYDLLIKAAKREIRRTARFWCNVGSSGNYPQDFPNGLDRIKIKGEIMNQMFYCN